MKKVTVGIIGTGFSAELHANSYKLISGIEVDLKACASLGATIDKFAEKYNIPYRYNDYKEMLKDESIDVIDICTPVKLHAQMIIDALNAGKHVISEKPLTGYCGEEDDVQLIGNNVDREKMFKTVMKDAERIKEALDRNNKLFMYAENWIYAPSVVKCVEFVKARKSKILFMKGEESHNGSHAFHAANWKITGGGALIRMGCHPISAILHLKNEEAKARGEEIKVLSVVADTGFVTENLKKEERKYIEANPVDVEDWGQATITFSDGTKATVIAGDIILGGVKNCLEIYNNESVLISNMTPNNGMMSYFADNNQLDNLYITEKVGNKQGWQYVCYSEEFERGYVGELQDFMQCVAYDRKPVSDFKLAYDTIKVVYGAYLSSSSGKRVEL